MCMLGCFLFNFYHCVDRYYTRNLEPYVYVCVFVCKEVSLTFYVLLFMTAPYLMSIRSILIRILSIHNMYRNYKVMLLGQLLKCCGKTKLVLLAKTYSFL